jgi:hypothetical protein
LSGAVAKLASINLRKLALSPTDSINLGFILREDLLLCSSYFLLGVPNWAVIYTPSENYSLLIVGDSNVDRDGGGVDGDGSGAFPRPGRVPEQRLMSPELRLQRRRRCGTFFWENAD